MNAYAKLKAHARLNTHVRLKANARLNAHARLNVHTRLKAHARLKAQARPNAHARLNAQVKSLCYALALGTWYAVLCTFNKSQHTPTLSVSQSFAEWEYNTRLRSIEAE